MLLRHGEGLMLSDGRIVEVRAAPEPLYQVRARDSRHLLQLAWHLGNRHCPAQIVGESLRIRRDHTLIARCSRGSAARWRRSRRPFDPKGGAYASRPYRTHHDR